MSPPRDLAALTESPPRGSAALPVSPLRGSAAPAVFPDCVLVMPAAASAPAPVPRVAEPYFSDWFIFTRLHPEVLIANTVAAGLARPVNSLHRLLFRFRLQVHLAGPPTVPSSRFPLPEPFCALSPRSGARSCGVSPLYRALSPQTLAPPLNSGSVSRLRRPPTAPSSLFLSPQLFLLPMPAPPLDSGSVSYLLRKTIPCGGRS